ncbi:hypothetical protein MMC25_006430 [Agyrium rufum]|nr:hypothetical protein [Agyrium rufum]
MVNYGFILFPLYFDPMKGKWDVLIAAAKANPSVTFQAIINPDDGPGGIACPPSDYIDVTSYQNRIPNTKTLGYVYTTNKYDCGTSETDICPCAWPYMALTQNWATAGCTTKNQADTHIDGIFFDEAPFSPSYATYMRNVTNLVKSSFTKGNTVVFNSGEIVDPVYWSIADYINVFEDTQTVYDEADIGFVDGVGTDSRQTTLIIYNYDGGSVILQRDVNTILDLAHDAIAGLYVDPTASYLNFRANWSSFVSDVFAVVRANMSSTSKKAE